MINKNEIYRIVGLSKLRLSNKDIESYSDDINAVLNFADINSKHNEFYEEAAPVSQNELRCDETFNDISVSPSEISPYAENSFYKIGKGDFNDC